MFIEIGAKVHHGVTGLTKVDIILDIISEIVILIIRN
jgi:hypothetical protein